MNKKLLAILLAVGILATGCQKSDDKKVAEETPAETVEVVEEKETPSEEMPAETEEESALEGWEGTWNNIDVYFEKPEFDEAFEEAAANNNETVEEFKAALRERRRSDFDGLVVEGDKVTFLDGFESEGGQEIASGTYELKEVVKVDHEGYELEWSIFESEDNEMYPVLLLMEVHGEEALTHFHMRYGDNAEELMNIEGWYPTFIKPTSTNEQIENEIKE